MRARPSIKSLIGESHHFIMDNKDVVLHFVRPVFVPLVVLTLIASIGGYYSKWFSLVEVAGIYFWSCLTLAWHRAVLLGPRLDQAVNPMALRPGEGKFITAVYGLSLAPAVVGVLTGLLSGIAKNSGNAAIAAILILLAIFVLIGGLLAIMRWLFILPARSVNADISLKEAAKISRGLLWPLFCAGLITSIAVFAIIIIPVILMSLLIGVFFSAKTLPFIVAAALFVKVPCLLATLYIVLMNVGILSRLYQWSVQERG